MDKQQNDIKLLEELRSREVAARETMLLIAAKRREIITRLHDNGMTLEKIAGIYGIKKQRVSQIINRGVK